jgi:hypothetical protein
VLTPYTPYTILQRERLLDEIRKASRQDYAVVEQQLQIGVVGWEEQRPEHQRRGGGVDVEIIEFHRRADQAGGKDAAGGGWL